MSEWNLFSNQKLGVAKVHIILFFTLATAIVTASQFAAAGKGSGAGDAKRVSEEISDTDPELEQELRDVARKEEHKAALADAKIDLQLLISQTLGLYRLVSVLKIGVQDTAVAEMTPDKLEQMLGHLLTNEELPSYVFDISLEPIIENGREMTFRSSTANDHRPSQLIVNWPKFSKERSEANCETCSETRVTYAGFLSTILHEGYVMAGLEESFEYSHSKKTGRIFDKILSDKYSETIAPLLTQKVKEQFPNSDRHQYFCSELPRIIKALTDFKVDARAVSRLRYGGKSPLWNDNLYWKIIPFLDFQISACDEIDIQKWRTQIENAGQDLTKLKAIELGLVDRRDTISSNLSFTKFPSGDCYEKKRLLKMLDDNTALYSLLMKKFANIYLSRVH